jgi:penicillin-binding protein 1C
MSPQAAFIVTDILSDNSARAPAFGDYSVLNLGFPCAVKTGTSKDYRDNWTVGFTSEYLVGVWIGNFDGSPMHGVSGITGAGPLFRDIMLALRTSEPPGFVPPEGLVQQRICPRSGELCGPDCPGSITEWYLPGSEPNCVCSVHQRYALDRRTGLPAGNETPLDEVEETVFEVFPPLYYSWMQSVGLPFPPNSAVCSFPRGHDPNRFDSGSCPRTASLSIVFPTRNSIFKRDPDIAAEFQSVELCAVVPKGCPQVNWTVDDSLIQTAGPPFTAFWSLEPGRHRIRCSAEGQKLSDEVSVVVLR